MAGPITIHFVCTGNVYRSRLAEAYCISLNAAGVRAFSSGIAAGRDSDVSISPYAAEILTKQGLLSYASARWQRTTAELVQSCDVLVFMEDEHHRFCESWIEPARQRVEIWGVKDIDDIEAAEIPGEVERTFEIIRRHVDALMARLVE
jgi:protein-tyrosine-phosphatase